MLAVQLPFCKIRDLIWKMCEMLITQNRYALMKMLLQKWPCMKIWKNILECFYELKSTTLKCMQTFCKVSGIWFENYGSSRLHKLDTPFNTLYPVFVTVQSYKNSIKNSNDFTYNTEKCIIRKDNSWWNDLVNKQPSIFTQFHHIIKMHFYSMYISQFSVLLFCSTNKHQQLKK